MVVQDFLDPKFPVARARVSGSGSLTEAEETGKEFNLSRSGHIWSRFDHSQPTDQGSGRTVALKRRDPFPLSPRPFKGG